MSASLMQKTKAEPNLTPILDMVFQLITFFMLVINFKSASLDLSLRLPIVGSARPVDTKGMEDLLILNITQDGKLIVYGISKDIESYIAGEALATVNWAHRSNPDLKFGDELPSMVVIRADEATPFKLLNLVIKACQDNGYRRFALMALNKRI
ncbi:MAG: biopolymer transporter ExbD [Thermoguttaceae bacterium]